MPPISTLPPKSPIIPMTPGVDLFVSLVSRSLSPIDTFEGSFERAYSLIGFQKKTTPEELEQLSRLMDAQHQARMRRINDVR
ncbi:MAG: hypothetical protein V4534_05665 [Myxococcota bacterium]